MIGPKTASSMYSQPGATSGIRYDERLEHDKWIAVPIGPRVQRFATALSHLSRSSRLPQHPSRPVGTPACASFKERRDGAVGV